MTEANYADGHHSDDGMADIPAGSETIGPSGDEEPVEGQTREQAEQGGEIEEIGGPKGPEPTRYGDWERAGRCSDF